MAPRTTTRSNKAGPGKRKSPARKPRTQVVDGVEIPSNAELERLKISPEVAWYLVTRGFPMPTCPPKYKTPEPRKYTFDPARVDKVLTSFSLLRHTQGRWAGKALRPDPWQVAYIIAPVFGWVKKNEYGEWVRVARSLYVDVPRKNGKGVHTGEMILTRDGWKRFGDLKVGDEVHAVDGTLTEVTYTSPVRELDCYRVTFSDGQSVVCDADHLWTVWDRYGHDPKAWAESRAGGGPRVRGAWRTVGTPELAATHRAGARKDTRYSVQMDRTLDRPAADLPIDPYLLGLWLGDGHTAAARITTTDDEIWKAFQKAGYTVRQERGTITYAINGGFRVALREAGLLGRKHVPEEYLTASAEQRMSLLHGLMDTDGSVITGPNTPRAEFVTTKQELADAVLFLARSLGWKATSKESRAKLNGVDCGPRWRVSWTARQDHSPFSLARKTSRLAELSERRTRSTTNPIVSVERVPTVPTMCIQVAHPSHQFLVGRGLIPTHNTTISGGLATYLTCADGEQGAQVVAAAASKDQAGFCFNPIKNLAEKSPALGPHVKVLTGKIIHKRTGSYFTVISSLADLIHGANIHAAVIDELHVHKKRDLVDGIETGTGARQQPLIVIITTADDGKPNTIYAEKREYIEKLARRALSDSSSYGVVFGADESDDPFAEETWKKANPGYGISPTKEFLEAESRKAAQNPANLSRFLRLHLGIRTKQETKYLELAAWDASAGMVDETKLEGRPCHAGLDLASVEDLAACAYVFYGGYRMPNEREILGEAGEYSVVWRFWLPEDRLQSLDDRTAGAARVWVREGWIKTTPGNVIDNEAIVKQIGKDAEKFRIRTVGYDRWGATDVVRRLGDGGLECVPVTQTCAALNAAMKETLRATLARTLWHGGNPVMRWMVDNLATAFDSSGNVRPDKKNSAEKIDGVSAMVNGIKEALDAETEVLRNKPATAPAHLHDSGALFRPTGRLSL